MKSVEGKLKTLECKFSKALQEVNQSLSTKLSEIEARLKVPVIDGTLKSLENANKQASSANYCLVVQLSEIKKRLKEPYMEERIKSSEHNNKQPTNAVIEDTATQRINEYKDM